MLKSNTSSSFAGALLRSKAMDAQWKKKRKLKLWLAAFCRPNKGGKMVGVQNFALMLPIEFNRVFQ